AAIRAAVPEVTGVRLTAPSAGLPLSSPDTADSLSGAVQQILDAEVNPAIAGHHGHVPVADAAAGWIRIRLEGGCQGCGLAEVTIRQGIEPLLRAALPGIARVIEAPRQE